MPKLIELLKSFGPRKLAAAAAAALTTAAMVVSVAWFATRPDMTVLYAGLDPADAGQVLAAVEAMGIEAVPSNGGTAVSVPRGDVDRVRMALAEKGLPTTPGVGYELFDKADGFGLTTFMQKVNRLRAMEGELARTVSTIKGVDSARVHLVLPERESFSRSAPEPSASVMVRMKGGLSLEPTQARAIRHLVASAVPGLKPGSVTITDSDGRILLADGESDPAGKDSKSDMEERLQRVVEEILTARLGPGNVRVGVSVEVENAREVIRKESYDPNGRVVRSTQTIEDRQRSSEGSGESPVTVQQNLPGAELLFGEGQASSANTSERVEETVNYEISKETLERVAEPGALRRLSVAVLVNGSYVEAPDGSLTYVERTPEELASLEQIVKTAVGYDESRGDAVSIQSLQFAEVPEAGSDGDLSAAEILAANAGQIGAWIVAGLVAVLAFLFVIRPLMRLLTEQAATPPAAAAAAETAPVDMPQPEAATVAAPPSRELLLQELHELVDENLEETAAVLRAWIQEGA